ncbi:hypothetical protein JKF63_07485 [Porcisia hertigi]|uniref:Uncharacterized protein n=1 Tax=Porcisia hertigi TaxID=2761500 RepID=A0A836LH95_9TRYP|nr:hypothetical protein JKF63_07485 [Porcisia hertigi]
MFAALSWLLDLDEGRSASSSSTCSRDSHCDSSGSDADGKVDQPATRTTYSDAGGHVQVELNIASVMGAALVGSPSEAAPFPSSTVYSSPPPRQVEDSFADLDARKVTLFASSSCEEPVYGVGPLADLLEGQGVAPASSASPSSLKTLPQWSLRGYANEAVSLSPIASPAHASESTTAVCTTPSARHEAQRPLLVREGVTLSACLSSPDRGTPCAAAEREEAVPRGWVSSANEAGSRRQAGALQGFSASRGEHTARDGIEGQENDHWVPDAKSKEVQLVRRAMRVALMASTRPCAPADVPPHQSNPFFEITAGAAVSDDSTRCARWQPQPELSLSVARASELVPLACAAGAPNGAPAFMGGALRQRSAEELLNTAAAAPHNEDDARGGEDSRSTSPLTCASVGTALRDSHLVKSMQDTPTRDDLDVVHLANGLVTVTCMNSHQCHQKDPPSPLLTSSAAAPPFMALFYSKKPHFDFS